MLEIPQKFKNDIEGKDTQLIPIIIIDDRIHVSTNKIELENIYSPLIKDIGSVNQSIDIGNRRFQISIINVSLYNYEYNDEYLSDKLFTPSVINKKLTIYMKSPSAETITDCLMIYAGYIKEIKESSNIVKVYIEDKTEKTLHKKLPIEYVRDDIDVPDRYKNKRVPMVYGDVKKAPCVYYNIYGSALESGSTKYSITPDTFPLANMEKPCVFENDVYLEIKDNADFFNSASEGTLYQATLKQQYHILSSMILVDKQLNVETPASGAAPEQFLSFDTSPIGYNMVEVKHSSPVVFLGGTNDVHTQLHGADAEKTTAPIQMFKDINSHYPSTEIEGSYLDIKDFTNIPSSVSDSEYWVWGHNPSIDSDNYYNIYGENIINFEAKEFCSDSSVVSKLPTADGFKDIKSWVWLEFDLETAITAFTTSTGGAVNMPILAFRWADAYSPLWDINDDGHVSGSYSKSSFTDTITTSDVTNIIFSIGQRKQHPVSKYWQLLYQQGSMDWLKINSMKLSRQALLEDYISYEIYVDVLGRVDNVDGTYTGTAQYTLSQRQDYFEGRRMDAGISSYRPVKTTAVKEVEAKKKKVKKKKVKKESKY